MSFDFCKPKFKPIEQPLRAFRFVVERGCESAGELFRVDHKGVDVVARSSALLQRADPIARRSRLFFVPGASPHASTDRAHRPDC